MTGVAATVARDPGGHHGFPWRASCPVCGWRSAGYCAEHAARDMAQAHLDEGCTLF